LHLVTPITRPMTSSLASSEIPITQPYPDVIVDFRGVRVRVRVRARARVTREGGYLRVTLMNHVSFADVVPLTQLCRLTSCTKCNSPHINHQCTYFLFHDLNTVSRAPPQPYPNSVSNLTTHPSTTSVPMPYWSAVSMCPLIRKSTPLAVS